MSELRNRFITALPNEPVPPVTKIEEFERMLGDDFVESNWQKWFEKNSWILGSEFVRILDERYIDIANKVALLVDKLGICQENNPKSIAVGCIYLISQNYNLGFTKKEIADNCHTSEVTVSNTYSQMAKFKKYLFPKNV